MHYNHHTTSNISYEVWHFKCITIPTLQVTLVMKSDTLNALLSSSGDDIKHSVQCTQLQLHKVYSRWEGVQQELTQERGLWGPENPSHLDRLVTTSPPHRYRPYIDHPPPPNTAPLLTTPPLPYRPSVDLPPNTAPLLTTSPPTPPLHRPPTPPPHTAPPLTTSPPPPIKPSHCFFQYCPFLASPESGGIWGSTVD